MCLLGMHRCICRARPQLSQYSQAAILSTEPQNVEGDTNGRNEPASEGPAEAHRLSQFQFPPGLPSVPCRLSRSASCVTWCTCRRTGASAGVLFPRLPSSPSATWESWLSLQEQDDGDGDRATESRRQLRFYGEISRLMSIDGGERCRLPSPARLSSTESCPSKWQYNRAE